MKILRAKGKKTKWRWAFAILVVAAATIGAVMAPAYSAVGEAPAGKGLHTMMNSPNYKDGRFVNGLPAEEPQFFKSLQEWVKGADNTVPDEPVSVVEQSGDAFRSLPESGLRITWVGHSTTLVEIDGVRLLLDPIWSDVPSPLKWTGPKRFYAPPIALDALPLIDAVLISHDHYDHLDRDTVVALAQKGYSFVVPLGVGARLRGWKIEDRQIVELDWWGQTRVKDVVVTATPARHFSGRSMVMSDRDKTLWSGFAMAGSQNRVYYTGDTGMFPGFREIGERLGPFDATLVEVGAYHQLWADLHLGPEQAVAAVKAARGGLLVPVHWATFDLAMHSWVEPAERLIMATKAQGVPLALPRPGQSIEPSNPPPVARWWPEIPWETERDHPIVSSGMPGSVQE